MTRPVIAMNLWRRELPTFLDDATLLYTLADEYVRVLRDAGATVVLLPHVGEDEVAGLLDVVDALVLSGGGDVDPASYGRAAAGSKDVDASADRSEVALVREARRRSLPTLAICRGMQIANVAFGGTLQQDVGGTSDWHAPISSVPAEVLRASHPVELVPGSLLTRIYGSEELVVNTIHHQAIDRLADGFVATATAPDGIVEGIEVEDDDWPFLGVQWHPEKGGEADLPLFRWFVADLDRRLKTQA